jgi:hypothetical protein
MSLQVNMFSVDHQSAPQAFSHVKTVAGMSSQMIYVKGATNLESHYASLQKKFQLLETNHMTVPYTSLADLARGQTDAMRTIH